MHTSSVAVTKEGEGVTPGCYSDQDQHLIVRWEPRPEAVLVLTKTVHNGRVGLTHHQQRGSHQNWWICQLLVQCWWWRFPFGWPPLSDLNLKGIDSIIENDIHPPPQLPSNPHLRKLATARALCVKTDIYAEITQSQWFPHTQFHNYPQPNHQSQPQWVLIPPMYEATVLCPSPFPMYVCSNVATL